MYIFFLTNETFYMINCRCNFLFVTLSSHSYCLLHAIMKQRFRWSQVGFFYTTGINNDLIDN